MYKFFLDHFDYLKRVTGAESIGIGADFDGAQGQVNISSTSILTLQNFCLRTLLCSVYLSYLHGKRRFLQNLNTKILHSNFLAINNIVVLSAPVNTLYNI